MIVLLNKGSFGYSTASQKLYDDLQLLKQSSATARTIISYVENPPGRQVEIAIIACDQPGAFGPFNETFGFNGPCIIWNPENTMRTLAATITGFFPSGKAKYSGKKSETFYPPCIVLIHELGHAKQYIEDSGRFPSKSGSTTSEGAWSTDEIEADNLRRHENPVCRDMGLLQRVKYDDFDFR